MTVPVKAILILLVLSFSLSALFFVKKAYMLSYPVLGAEEIRDVRIIEDHRDALRYWQEKGIRNAVLINVDAHDDLKKIPAADIEGMKKAIHSPSAENGQDGGGLATAGNNNFIYAAAKLGVVKKVVWVVPVTYGIYTDSGARLVSLLKMYGFHDQDIVTFEHTGRYFTGTVDGIPVIICDPETLPDLNEPVLFSVDVDFFPAMINDTSFIITKTVTDTFKAIFEKEYEVRDAVVAYSVNGGFLSVSYRWVGNLVIDLLRDPALLEEERLPTRYLFLQRADMLLLMKRYDELLHHLTPYIDEENIDPSIYIYAAQAYHGLGDRGNSFHWAEKACLTEKTYCYGLPELGIFLLDQYGIESAEMFFSRGYGLCPDMDHGQFRFAMALKEAGKYDEAVRYFKTFRSCYGAFPVDFYIAETCLLKGDNASALAFYDSGRSAVLHDPSLLAGFGDFRAIEGAVAFYEAKGFSLQAQELREVLNRRN